MSQNDAAPVPEPERGRSSASGDRDAGAETVGAGLKRGALGTLKFLAHLLPELTVALVCGVIGLVVGLVFGAATTADLLSGPGPWARAGPIALLLPLLTLLGPPLIGAVIGVFAPIPFVLALHGAVLLPFRFRDRHAAVWATTVAYWLPMLFAIRDGVAAGLVSVVMFGPFTGALAFVAAATWVGARGILHGRSVSAWWREADKSMVVTAALLTTVGCVILWFSCVLVCFVPLAPVALALSAALSVRLLALGRRRGLAGVLLAIDLVHLALFVLVVTIAALGDHPSPHAG